MRIDEVTAPAYWASYLVNGDASGMTDAEVAACDAYMAGWRVLDVKRDDDDHFEPRFTWHYELHGGAHAGGEVLDYLVTPIDGSDCGGDVITEGNGQ